MASAESSDISSRTVLFATSPEIVEWREQTYKLLHARCAALRALEEQAVDSADEYDQADPKQDVGDSLFNAIGPSFEAAMSIESSPWPRRDIGGLVSEDISIDLAKPAMCTLGFWFQVWQDNRFYAEGTQSCPFYIVIRATIYLQVF